MKRALILLALIAPLEPVTIAACAYAWLVVFSAVVGLLDGSRS